MNVLLVLFFCRMKCWLGTCASTVRRHFSGWLMTRIKEAYLTSICRRERLHDEKLYTRRNRNKEIFVRWPLRNQKNPTPVHYFLNLFLYVSFFFIFPAYYLWNYLEIVLLNRSKAAPLNKQDLNGQIATGRSGGAQVPIIWLFECLKVLRQWTSEIVIQILGRSAQGALISRLIQAFISGQSFCHLPLVLGCFWTALRKQIGQNSRLARPHISSSLWLY